MKPLCLDGASEEPSPNYSFFPSHSQRDPRVIPGGSLGQSRPHFGSNWRMVSRVTSCNEALWSYEVVPPLAPAQHKALGMSTLVKILWKVCHALLFSRWSFKRDRIREGSGKKNNKSAKWGILEERWGYVLKGKERIFNVVPSLEDQKLSDWVARHCVGLGFSM